MGAGGGGSCWCGRKVPQANASGRAKARRPSLRVARIVAVSGSIHGWEQKLWARGAQRQKMEGPGRGGKEGGKKLASMARSEGRGLGPRRGERVLPSPPWAARVLDAVAWDHEARGSVHPAAPPRRLERASAAGVCAGIALPLSGRLSRGIFWLSHLDRAATLALAGGVSWNLTARGPVPAQPRLEPGLRLGGGGQRIAPTALGLKPDVLPASPTTPPPTLRCSP